jgi:putative redox protein
MTMNCTLNWQEGMRFSTRMDGFELILDAASENGGTNQGPRPKGLLLTALAGCTAMDVISILNKMKVTPVGFEVSVDGELAADHPRRFTEITVHYRFKGPNLDRAKLEKAIDLSEEKYCGVSASLKPQVRISHRLFINDEEA